MLQKVAIITGGDSGIGRAIAYLFAKEGADIAIVYLNEHGDALETKETIQKLGRRCLTIAGDIGSEAFCRQAVEHTSAEYGRIDILINNAAELTYQLDIEKISGDSGNDYLTLLYPKSSESFGLTVLPQPVGPDSPDIQIPLLIAPNNARTIGPLPWLGAWKPLA